ncbi:MAG: hypothetical protein EXR62_02565 [Chloroflexi bacterium]|nr:hypothetical protein [Chloroflexota bacterium]
MEQADFERIEELTSTTRERSLPPDVQRDAGFMLGRMAAGSPALLAHIRPDLDAVIQIPAGEFLFGDDKRPTAVPEPFAIGKYPVTNLQFRRFIDGAGYEQEEFWSQDGWAWRTGAYETQEIGDHKKAYLARRTVEKRSAPYVWHNSQWNNPLAPVVWITWFEAEAYTHWLAREYNRPARLPTETEWEYAARGAQGRIFAWGDTFERHRLNCGAFWAQDDDGYAGGIDTASTMIVGQFPEGGTPEGICDLSGNVWEWTTTWDETQPAHRIIRGGSWNDPRAETRGAERNAVVPDLFNDSIGFRVVFPVNYNN